MFKIHAQQILRYRNFPSMFHKSHEPLPMGVGIPLENKATNDYYTNFLEPRALEFPQIKLPWQVRLPLKNHRDRGEWPWTCFTPTFRY